MNPRLKPIIALATIAVLMLGLNGHWTDPWLLTFLALWSALVFYAMSSISDDLARERFNPPEAGADAQHLYVIRGLALASLILGALDTGRWHLFLVPTPLRLAGFAGYVLFGLLVFRAMIANRFFSAVVRIQNDRNHYVIDQGPYSVVRHPGYAGMMFAVPFSMLALGSWLSFGCAVVLVAMLLRRVVFEDAFLRANLKGYQEYLTRVPYRLVPGVW